MSDIGRPHLDLPVLEELAARAEERAERVRLHAREARAQAARDAAHGDVEAHALHAREAEAHENAALTIEQTAELYRQRVRHIRARRADP